MKKVKNMNIDEARQAFAKFEAKHPRNDDFDMSDLLLFQCGEISRGTDPEAISTMLYDLFNYGFMAGYKQSEADLKTKIDKRVKDDMHRKLLELVYYLPFGYKAEYFYCMMSYLLPEDCFLSMPNRITKPMLEIRAEREDKKAEEVKPEPEQTAEEKKSREYRCNITRMIYDIENLDTIASIYSFIMGMLSVKKGGIADE
ncbi:MAG: hypothetical protein K2O03_11360 [Lachnospiraceae bacterium]|nr:hypothetical protein [Lachnospiraceae bacterium]